jgi:hypothetical protein
MPLHSRNGEWVNGRDLVAKFDALLARTDELTESVRVRDETIENARRERVTLRARTDELTRIAGFFASVARSGEAWSTTCDETFAALADSAQPPRTPL